MRGNKSSTTSVLHPLLVRRIHSARPLRRRHGDSQLLVCLMAGAER
jgi:hypothetical protein